MDDDTPPHRNEARQLNRGVVLMLVGSFCFAVVLYGNGDAGPHHRSAVPLAVLYLVAGLGQSIAGMSYILRAIQAPTSEPSERPTAFAYAAFAVMLTVLAFGNVYYIGSARQPNAFNEPLSVADSLYLAVSTLTSVTNADVLPLAGWARLVVAGQMLFDILVAGILIAGVFLLANRPPADAGGDATPDATEPTTGEPTGPSRTRPSGGGNDDDPPKPRTLPGLALCVGLAGLGLAYLARRRE